MINLREQAESDLAHTLEGEFALPVELISPDGVLISVVGQVLYDTVRESPDTGEDIISNEPIVVLRRSSLSRIPLAGENWDVRIPVNPDAGAPKENFVLSAVRPPEGGRSLGFIRLYLTRNEQKP